MRSFAFLLALQLSPLVQAQGKGGGSNLDSCVGQFPCLSFSVEPDFAGCKSGCLFKVCMTVNTSNEGCAKGGDTISHVCDRNLTVPDDGTCTVTEGLPDYLPSTGPSPPVSDFEECVWAEPDTEVVFVSKDANDCDTTGWVPADNGGIECERRDTAGIASCSGNGNSDKECAWTIPVPSCPPAPPALPPPSSPDPTIPPGETEGDPHLTFADGGEADLRGEDQHTYALLSAPRASVNGKIEAADYHLTGRIMVKGTFFDVAYLTLITRTGRCLRVEHRANNLSQPMRFIGDCVGPLEKAGEQSYPLPEGSKLVIDDVTVHHAERLDDDTETLTVESQEWRITTTSHEIRSLKNVVKVMQFPEKRQLDISVQALRDPLLPRSGAVVAPHGILGQAYDGDNVAVDGNKDSFGALLRKTDTYPYREIVTAAQAEGAIEGDVHDYEVRSGFATDFKFSRFNMTKSMPPRDVAKLSGTKRQMSYNWQANGGAEGLAPALD